MARTLAEATAELLAAFDAVDAAELALAEAREMLTLLRQEVSLLSAAEVRDEAEAALAEGEEGLV